MLHLQAKQGRGTFQLRCAVTSVSFQKRFGNVEWPATFYTEGHSLAKKLPLEQFNRRFTKKCRIDSPFNHGSERLYLEAFDSTFHVFALVFPESELKAIKVAS